MGSAWAVALLAPLLAASAWTLAVAVGEQRGKAPLSAPRFRNGAEAAAAGDAAAVLRFFRLGEDPTRIRHIRPEFISGDVVRVTTAEAGVWSRNVKMMQLLDREGALVDPDERRHLACLAADLRLADIASYLAPERTCEDGAAVQRIVARSKAGGAGDE